MFRIDDDGQDGLVFNGHLTVEALRALRARCLATSARRVRLDAGTEVAPECMSELAALPADLVATSAYLARWLQAVRDAGRGG